MYSSDGNAVALTTGNLYIIAADTLVTPPANHSGIAGTRRQKILNAWAPACGLPVRERALRPSDIESADEVFYSNSLVGLRPVCQLGDVLWDTFTTCEALFAAYADELL